MANIIEIIKKRIQLSRLRKGIVPIVVTESPRFNPDNGEEYLNWVPRKCDSSAGKSFSKK